MQKSTEKEKKYLQKLKKCVIIQVGVIESMYEWMRLHTYMQNLKGKTGLRDLHRTEQSQICTEMQKRHNVRKCLGMAMLLFVLEVPMLALGSYFHLMDLTGRKWIFSAIGFTCLMAGFICILCWMISEKKDNLFHSGCVAFWLTFIGMMTYIAWHSCTQTIALVCFFCGIIVLGGVPYFHTLGRLGCNVIYGVCCLGVTYHKHFSAEQFACVMSWLLFGYFLSTTRYKDARNQETQKVALRSAEQQAETDPMTKLRNRRGLDRHLETAIPYCIRNELSVAVLMMDIDFFKKYNDAFGHGMGDQCIQSVARQIQIATRRKTDLAARVGGEEFLVFLTGLEPDAALLWAKRLQTRIEALEIPHARETGQDIVTLSIGIACGTIRQKEDFAELQRQADEQLYCAKEQGRACCSLQGHCHRSSRMAKNWKLRLRA